MNGGVGTCAIGVCMSVEIVICQLHPPNYLKTAGLGCVVAVDASSFVRDCLHLDITRKEFNYMKLRSSSATSNKSNNSTCPKGLNGLAGNTPRPTPV